MTKFNESCVAINTEGKIIGKKRIGIARVFDFAYIVKKATMHAEIVKSIVPIRNMITNSIKSPPMLIFKKTIPNMKDRISIIPKITPRYTSLAINITCGLIDKESNA